MARIVEFERDNYPNLLKLLQEADCEETGKNLESFARKLLHYVQVRQARLPGTESLNAKEYKRGLRVVRNELVSLARKIGKEKAADLLDEQVELHPYFNYRATRIIILQL